MNTGVYICQNGMHFLISPQRECLKRFVSVLSEKYYVRIAFESANMFHLTLKVHSREKKK